MEMLMMFYRVLKISIPLTDETEFNDLDVALDHNFTIEEIKQFYSLGGIIYFYNHNDVTVIPDTEIDHEILHNFHYLTLPFKLSIKLTNPDILTGMLPHPKLNISHDCC